MAADDDNNEAIDDYSRLLKELLSQETTSRGRPKAPCYKDILLKDVLT